MSIRAYVRARWAALLVGAVALAAACGIAAVCGMTRSAVVMLGVTLAGAGAVALALDYTRCRRFFGEIAELAAKLEHPYQLHSLVAEPQSPDLRIVHQALCTMGRASAGEVAQAHVKLAQHREYMEGWVHEMKTPLAAASLVADRLDEPAASQLKRELDRMERQVAQVLWYARSECPENDYLIREVPLANLARQACKENARFLIEQGVSPIIEVGENIRVLTDSKQAVFVLSQVVVNAAKYGARRITFACEHVRDAAGAQQVLLRIADDGSGIPAQDVPRVFERGFTGAHGRAAGSSTGMGLYLAAQLCARLGLGLSLSSEEGEGTCVTVAFPLDRRVLGLEPRPGGQA